MIAPISSSAYNIYSNYLRASNTSKALVLQLFVHRQIEGITLCDFLIRSIIYGADSILLKRNCNVSLFKTKAIDKLVFISAEPKIAI